MDGLEAEEDQALDSQLLPNQKSIAAKDNKPFAQLRLGQRMPRPWKFDGF